MLSFSIGAGDLGFLLNSCLSNSQSYLFFSYDILVPSSSTLLLLWCALSTMLIQMASGALNGFPFCHLHPILLIRVRVISLKDSFFHTVSDNKITPICSQGPSQALGYTKHILLPPYLGFPFWLSSLCSALHPYFSSALHFPSLKVLHLLISRWGMLFPNFFTWLSLTHLLEFFRKTSMMSLPLVLDQGLFLLHFSHSFFTISFNYLWTHWRQSLCWGNYLTPFWPSVGIQ